MAKEWDARERRECGSSHESTRNEPSQTDRAVLADVASRTIKSSTALSTLLAVFSTVLLGSVAALAGLLVLPLPVSAGFLVGVATLVVVRHVSVLRGRRLTMGQAWKAAKRGSIPDSARIPPTYFLYVLGSGGHTGELCEMIKQQFRPHSDSHRRYVITSGDIHSEHAVARLEGRIQQAFPAVGSLASGSGTWDVCRVVRARRVHQPLWSTWYTAALSALSIIQALVRHPQDRKHEAHKQNNQDSFDYPHLIVTNGPGTGFIVCLVAHVLKMLGVIPSNRCRVLYIETWAHVSSLSLTGKLFYHSRLADIFVVQHESLAAKTGQHFIGEVAKYGNLLGVKKTLKSAPT